MALQPDSRKERCWLERIRLWQQAQLSVREFCRRRRLSEPSFYAWRRLLHERGVLGNKSSPQVNPVTTTPAFLKVTVKADAPVVTAIDLVLAEGRIVRVRPGFDPDLLRQLLRLLEEPSC
jgi:transposase